MKNLTGVIAASVTPTNLDGSIDLSGLMGYLEFLARRGCHGVLLFGTTGEGPSFSISQRKSLFATAQEFHSRHPDFLMLAGTGLPALEDTILITRMAFQHQFDGVVVLPPYYFKNVSVDGLFAWYDSVIKAAVPEDKCLLGYHIPQISGVPLPIELLQRLKERHPTRFAGIKDSSGDAALAMELGRVFGGTLCVFTGNDRLFDLALQNHASGCITALANLGSPLSRRVWDAHQQGRDTASAQALLTELRSLLDQYPPAPAALKAVLHAAFSQPEWPVIPPLVNFSADQTAALQSRLAAYPEIF